jgi:long-chain acyl-CoA synthetase
VSAETFPDLLDARAEESPSGVAMQEKLYGIWQPVTWAEYRDRVIDFANGLATLGVDRGAVVAVLGDNRPEWLISELAIQSIGASVVGVYPTSINEEILHVLTLAEVSVVVAEDQEQVDKLLKLKPQLPRLEHVIYYDPHGLQGYDDSLLIPFVDVEATGRDWRATDPEWLPSRRAKVTADDIAVICTTSGTTSLPKLAELSHRNMLEMSGALADIDPMSPKDRYVSFLPFAWMGEQMLAVACGMKYGFTISFPEDSSTQRSDLREIGPSITFSPPRIWESMLSEVQVRIDQAGWLKRAVFGWGYGVGERRSRRLADGDRIGLLLRLQHRVADWTALRPVRDQLGLARVRRCYTGGAPLGPDLFGFFHAIGVNLKQIYGQTEICGIAVVHRDEAVRYATVGVTLPGTELKIDDDGQILLRSAAVFAGYHRDEAATSKAKDPDGWLRTGDAGYLDEAGQLIVIDRLESVIHAADGSQFSAAFVENKLKFSPYVEEAVVVGSLDSTLSKIDDSLGAIVTIDAATVGAWAESNRLSYTTYADLASRPEIYELVAADVLRANADLREATKVKRFVILHKPFDPDDEEITRTRKIRRGVIRARYGDVIDAILGKEGSVDIDSVVAYQDGTRTTRTITLSVFDLDGFTVPDQMQRRAIWSTR